MGPEPPPDVTRAIFRSAYDKGRADAEAGKAHSTDALVDLGWPDEEIAAYIFGALGLGPVPEKIEIVG